MKKTNSYHRLAQLSLAFFICCMMFPTAFAEGLDKVNTFMDNIAAILTGIAVTVAAVAIMWAGFKMLYRGGDVMDCAKIAGGVHIPVQIDHRFRCKSIKHSS